MTQRDIFYRPTDPAEVYSVDRMRLFTQAPPFDEQTPVADVGPGQRVETTDATGVTTVRWRFTVDVPDGGYFLATTVTYTDTDSDGDRIVRDDTNDSVTLPGSASDELSLAGLEVLLERTLTVQQRSRAQSLLDKALGVAATACCLPTPLPPGIVSVVYDMTIRALGNPDGLQSENLGAYGYSRASETARGGTYLTKDERQTIRLACRRARGSAGVSSVKVTNRTYPRRELDSDTYELDEYDGAVSP